MRSKRNMHRWNWLFEQVFRVYGVNRVSEGPEIGVEIEVEGKSLITENPQYYWKVAHDGSLRVLEPDDRAVEYVFRKPLDRITTKKALEYLEKQLRGATIFESDRTSVHVHLNASDLKLIDVYKWLTLYFIFEPILQKYCGNSRMGNHFALSSVDSDYIVTHLVETLQIGGVPQTNNDMRYAACNYTALGKFGTLEFRAHEGTVSANRIQQWINILLAIKDAALSYQTPLQIVEEFSRRGPVDFAEITFGRELMEVLPVNGSDLYEGARLAQEIGYGFEWDEALECWKNLGKSTKTPQEEFGDDPDWVIRQDPPPPNLHQANELAARVLNRGVRVNNNFVLDEEDR